MQPWNEAGLGLLEFLGGRRINGESSVMWAQKSAGQQTSGRYSWHDVRWYYHQALVSTDPGTRNVHFWKAFEGLGRLMHLVQDASVPEHVRSDSHINPFSYNYEKYLRDKRYMTYIDSWLSSTDKVHL